MILVLKKIACLIAVFVIVFSVSAFADDEFYVYGEDNIDYLCEILDMNAGDITDYLQENNITYFACNKDNTKQIKKTESIDEFSKQVFDMSVLDDESILNFASELSGLPNTKGEIIEHKGLKLLKTEHETTDGGGKFILTQYITVEKSKKTVLSFYTAENVDRDYIQTAFKEHFNPQSDYALYLILGVGVFGFIGISVLVLLIKDFKKE